ncbi:YfhO family protein [Apilactobacillus ozensis]|uniref:YfhO family protein n=1 Tax=Apilactobacillus ozensis TaxID=866801 RepID=UPI0034E1D6EE
MIANQLNIMWLDGMIFLPIIILGVNKIVEKNNCKTYIIALSLMIIINYYIGYMICIFFITIFYILFCYKTRKYPK